MQSVFLLLYLDSDLLREVKTTPQVIDGNDLAFEGVALLIAEFAELVAVDTPFEGKGVLGEDGCCVFGIVANPLAVDLYLSSRNVEDDTFVITLAQISSLAQTDGGWQFFWHEVLQEESRRIHQDEWLGFRMTITDIIRISIAIQVESDMVSELSRRPNHI